MKFFHKTPSGRIVNRLSIDQQSVDLEIPESMSEVVLSIFSMLSVIITIVAVIPWFILVIIPMLSLYIYALHYVRRTCSELGRLISVSNSPIYSQYSESITGLETLRAYGIQKKLIKENRKILNKRLEPTFIEEGTFRWLGLRLYIIGLLCVLIVAIFSVAFRNKFSSSLLGLVLLRIDNLTNDLIHFVTYCTKLEADMNKVERILQLIDIDIEPTSEEESNQWIKRGNIEFRNVYMKYGEELPYVLNNVSFKINPNTKIAIVGKSGAGKSSLSSVLFRLVEPSDGTILIDGIDIAQLGLKELRSAITIIPQDPVLFSGTIRSNLDPFSTYTDLQIWNILERIHLTNFVQELPDKLEAKINANGKNLSIGQKQLICMGRALLRDTKIIIMDESTSSLDYETEKIILETISKEFFNKTLLMIAHRLNTINCCDKVIVMESGQIIEFESPSQFTKYWNITETL